MQHSPNAKIADFRPLIQELMIQTAEDYHLNIDLKKLINPTDRFVIGGSLAD